MVGTFPRGGPTSRRDWRRSLDSRRLVDPKGTRWTVQVPVTRRERMRGLKGRTSLSPTEGLLFERCRSVHTFGMRFPIDAVMLDRDLRVVTVRRMRPRRILLPRRRVAHVLECRVDAPLERGDVLRLT
jgi:uncharacterized membrane protein (UPF0127 family)